MKKTIVDWPNGMKFVQQDGQFKITTDSILLSDFASADKCTRACELGCGTAVIALQMAFRNPKLAVDCVEIQHQAAALAEENAAINGMSDRIRVIEGDLKDKSLLPADSYELVVCNPPYFV